MNTHTHTHTHLNTRTYAHTHTHKRTYRATQQGLGLSHGLLPWQWLPSSMCSFPHASQSAAVKVPDKHAIAQPGLPPTNPFDFSGLVWSFYCSTAELLKSRQPQSSSAGSVVIWAQTKTSRHHKSIIRHYEMSWGLKLSVKCLWEGEVGGQVGGSNGKR